MVVETLVLNGNKRVCHVLGNFIHGYLHTVGISGNKLANLIALTVVYEGGETYRCHITHVNVRCGSNNTVESTDAGGHAPDGDADKGDEDDLCTGKCNLVHPLRTFGKKRFLLCTDSFFSVIHKVSFLFCINRAQLPLMISIPKNIW